MPTYEYACAQCGIIEVFQSMSEDALKKCPQCSSKKIERLISGGAGLIFKGDGFWETDYNRSDDYKKKASEESTPKASTDAAAPQAQPAAKPEKAKPPKADKKPDSKPSSKSQRKPKD